MRNPELLCFSVACALFLGACSGGGGSAPAPAVASSTPTATPATANVATIVLDNGPTVNGAAIGALNEPYVSVTICSPSSPTTCQTIDHILVDTGSYGLRVISSVLSSSLTLPQETNASGNAIVECTTFADGYSWGPVKTVNLQIAGETANALPIQVIGDPTYSGIVPRACSSAGPAENTVTQFGANGVIGVGPFAQDCGAACVQDANENAYFACSGSSCTSIAISLAQQVPNPITFFASDNNGVIVNLPSVAASGSSSSVSGTMIFGVGTQSNNGLGSATVYTVSAETGYFTTTYKNVSYADSFIDSGSNGYFFTDSSIPQCSDGSGFYCPTSTFSLSAVNVGTNGNSGTLNFSVGSEETIAANVVAYPFLGGTNDGDLQSFDWGLPFFFGRKVFTVIQNTSTSGGVGPYFAY